jgi:serine/threonine protein kinase
MTTEPRAPETIGHYELDYLLGRGAMGAVYVARDRRIGRRVALKTIQIPAGHFSDDSRSDEYFKRLQREAEVCGSLLHPNIVTLYAVGYENNRVSYLSMELVEGETLLSLMKRFRPDPLPLETALRVCEDVLRALAHAHEKAIIHRDIKPANILIAADGTSKLADFGIARPIDSSMTGAGALIGTPTYMPPEQVLGKQLTTRADLFSLGVVMYEALAGLRPFVGNDITAILHNILTQQVANISDVNPAVPRQVGNFVARLMAKSSDDRPTAAEALQQVATLRAPAPPVTAGPGNPQSAWSPSSRRIAVAAGALIVFLAVPFFIVRARIDGSPTVTIPQAQIAEFETKRQALAEANAAYEAGRYEESLQRYEAYLLKYPDSVPALEGRDRSQAALDAQKPPEQRKAAAARKPPRKKDEDISPSELLNRLKKAIFR